jgi:hypothetical protein
MLPYRRSLVAYNGGKIYNGGRQLLSDVGGCKGVRESKAKYGQGSGQKYSFSVAIPYGQTLCRRCEANMAIFTWASNVLHIKSIFTNI